MTLPILIRRLSKELADLERDPPSGIVCYPVEDDITQLEAYIKGPPDSPFQNGHFQLEITVPAQYPFDPPQIRFKTPIYHPNIDDCGRICADILKKGTKGGWKPSLNLSTTLMALATLLACPNPDDPLEADIAKEYKLDYATFHRKALDYTQKHATECLTKGERSQPEIHKALFYKSLTPSQTTAEHVGKAASPDAVLEETEADHTDDTNPSKTPSKLSLSKKKQKAMQFPLPSPIPMEIQSKAKIEMNNIAASETFALEEENDEQESRALSQSHQLPKREHAPETLFKEDSNGCNPTPSPDNEKLFNLEDDGLAIIPKQKKRRLLSLSKGKKPKDA